jgi:hypothetical protein
VAFPSLFISSETVDQAPASRTILMSPGSAVIHSVDFGGFAFDSAFIVSQIVLRMMRGLYLMIRTLTKFSAWTELFVDSRFPCSL